MQRVIALVIFLSLFAHIFIDDYGLSWAVGWNIQVLVISFMSFVCWSGVRTTDQVARSVYLLICVYMSLSAIMQWVGIYLETEYIPVLLFAVSGFIWGLKQFLITKAVSDPISYDNYCYGLARVTEKKMTMLNLLRLGTIGLYGGRVVIAGSDVYLIHKGKFKKFDLKHIDISNITIIDTGQKFDDTITSCLNKKLGKRAIPLIRDCASLNCGPSLGYLLVRRVLRGLFNARQKYF